MVIFSIFFIWKMGKKSAVFKKKNVVQQARVLNIVPLKKDVFWCLFTQFIIVRCTYGGRVNFLKSIKPIEDDMDFTRDWSISFWVNADETGSILVLEYEDALEEMPLM